MTQGTKILAIETARQINEQLFLKIYATPSTVGSTSGRGLGFQQRVGWAPKYPDTARRLSTWWKAGLPGEAGAWRGRRVAAGDPGRPGGSWRTQQETGTRERRKSTQWPEVACPGGAG